ncbi:MAG: hypothetical protein ACI81R_001920 [Bradymonadia bacterium]|jgi:hypothetical protein
MREIASVQAAANVRVEVKRADTEVYAVVRGPNADQFIPMSPAKARIVGHALLLAAAAAESAALQQASVRGMSETGGRK